MNCRETRYWLDAHCDNELDLSRSVELEQHLRDCPACSASRQNLTLLRRQIRAAAFAAPENLRQRVSAALRAERDQARPAHRPLRWWLAPGLAIAAASLVVAFVLTQTLFRPDPERRVLDEVSDSHIRSLAGTHLVDVVSTDQHTVRPWFEGKIDFAPPVPDLATRGFELIGGRLDYVAGHPAAALVYQRRKHVINVFVQPATDADLARSPVLQNKTSRRGYQIVAWNSGGMSYWAVSEINVGELREFAEAFSRETTGR